MKPQTAVFKRSRINNMACLLLKTQISSHSQIDMNPNLYEAAAKGDIEPFRQIARDELESIATDLMNNTVLYGDITASHLTLQTEEAEILSVSTKFVEQILDLCPLVLFQANAEGDSRLHLAAKKGDAAIVGFLIGFAKKQPRDRQRGVESAARQMLEMKNEEQNTPLHEAVIHRNFNVAKILIEADPHVPYSANRNSETPLYMAAANGSVKIVSKILQKCPSPAHEGPDGKTAMHAAVYTYPTEVIKQLLEKKRGLTAVRDKYGWTPLHHAAYSGRELISKLLLDYDKSAARIGDKDRKMTALHLAAARGHILVVDRILSSCEDCCALVDERRWNFLHFAMVSLDLFQLSGLLIKHRIVRDSLLLSEEDVNGNTPLHVVAAVCRLSPRVGVLPVILKILGGNNAVNNDGISVEDVKRRGFPELEQEIQELSKNHGRGQYANGIIHVQEKKEPVDDEALKEMHSLHTVVATLIATVTFAAGFTLPGGYWGKEGPIPGTPILIKKAGFRAFVVSDVIAMVLSVSAIFIYFLTPTKTLRQTKHLSDMPHHFILVSLLAMVVAFITGTYAVLEHSVGLSVATCVLGSSFILFAFANMFMLARGLYQRTFGHN